MSLTLKRACPFISNIHQYYDTHALTMDPDPYAPRFLDRPAFADWEATCPATIPEDGFPNISQRSPSPPKRPRNTKNLSLNVPTAKNSISSTSAPPSPFRSPRSPRPPLRRPANLTINVHSLHRHPSTPELYSSNIHSPIVTSPAPYTAKQFPSQKVELRHTASERPKQRHTDPTVLQVPFAESVEREKAYPDGPRLIVEPNIWLYAAPDLELAKTYDVVVNVAKEVGNPFISHSLEPPRASPDFEESTPSPFSASSTTSNPSPSITSSTSSGLSPELASKHTESVTPTTYKYADVEYIHIPWDHNSSLLQELPGIVNTILDRSAQGKKVLVHCQCGVSRSATLVIALVMKKLSMGTHEAYAYVKNRSPWIGPNLSLIYQLTDYGRLCGYERKRGSSKSGQYSAPGSAPLGSSESLRYKDDEFPETVASALSRPSFPRTQSHDRPGFGDIDVDHVAQSLSSQSLSSPKFFISEDTSVKQAMEFERQN